MVQNSETHRFTQNTKKKTTNKKCKENLIEEQNTYYDIIVWLCINIIFIDRN